MSTRTNLPPQLVITNGSMAANITSNPTILLSLTGCSYGVSWTGTSPVGTLAVQVSDDYALNANGTVKNAGTWNTLTLDVGGTAVTSIPVTGNTGSGYIEIERTNAYAIRLVYTFGSGVGTLNARITAKVA